MVVAIGVTHPRSSHHSTHIIILTWSTISLETSLNHLNCINLTNCNMWPGARRCSPLLKRLHCVCLVSQLDTSIITGLIYLTSTDTVTRNQRRGGRWNILLTFLGPPPTKSFPTWEPSLYLCYCPHLGYHQWFIVCLYIIDNSRFYKILGKPPIFSSYKRIISFFHKMTFFIPPNKKLI